MAMMIRKSLFQKESLRTLGQNRMLEYFKNGILAHLKAQDTEPDKIQKAAYGVGTIRTWKGKKFIKGPDKKWRRYYDKESRGASMSIKNLMKKVEKIDSPEKLMQLVLLHRDRFADEYGHPIPIVQELSRYVSKRQDYLPENMEARRKEARSNAIKAGQKRAREKKEEAKKAAEENIRQKTERTKRQEEERKKASGEKSVEEWEQTGAADFKAGKLRKPPYKIL